MGFLVRGSLNLTADDDYAEKVLLLPDLPSTKAYILDISALAITVSGDMHGNYHISLGNKLLGQASEPWSSTEVYSASGQHAQIHTNNVGGGGMSGGTVSYKEEIILQSDLTRGGLIEQPVLRMNMDSNVIEGSLTAYYVLMFDIITLNNDIRDEMLKSQL